MDAMGIASRTGGARVTFLALPGAVVSIASIAWSIWRVPELPLEPAEIEQLRARAHQRIIDGAILPNRLRGRG